MLTFIYPR